MKCDSCGKEIVMESVFCNFCGTKVTESNEADAAEAAEKQGENPAPSLEIEQDIDPEEALVISKKKLKQPKKRKRNVLIFVGVVAIFVIALGGYQFLEPYMRYHKAEAFLDNKEYELAIAAFAELEDYKDAPQMLQESKYQYAVNDMKIGSYEIAIEKFKELQNYKDSKKQIDESMYQLGKQYFKDKKHEQAIAMFSQVLEYKKDVRQLYVEANYSEGKKQYSNGHFDAAAAMFGNSKNFKDSKDYLNKLSILTEFQGTWEEEDYGNKQIIIDGWNFYTVHFPHSHETKSFQWGYTLEGNDLKSRNITYQRKLDKLVALEIMGRDTFVKISNSVEVPKAKPAPRVGMTEYEAQNSNWGEPTDINKTTTQNGVSEQWVYDGFKYIYLEDGVVTKIEE
ncbi:hypothetical protein [Paenibacillus alvei]|uniref:Uncharacterized protein n=1 Tax=Paenibacillus alvei TaxID=44250 RepID=A0A383RIJ1_PAEAL|nr:hypothetical protein [Paenibacillus alvei]SYX86179.1 protein of unknown function [Paenibacillus alvei]